jgi:MFS family permease
MNRRNRPGSGSGICAVCISMGTIGFILPAKRMGSAFFERAMGMRGSAISLAVMLGPLAQALVGPWITPQITFAIGAALSAIMALVAFLLLKHPRNR